MRRTGANNKTCLCRMAGAGLALWVALAATPVHAAWETLTSNSVVANSGDYGRQWIARNSLSGSLSLGRANAVYVDAAGNVYSTGYLDSGGATLKDVVTAKHDAAGNLIWSATYNNAAVDNNDEGRALAVDAAGNVYVAGVTAGAATDFDILLIKYNPDGSQAWVRTYRQTGVDELDEAVAVVTDGTNVYVAGRSHNGSDLDIVVLRYDTAGQGQVIQVYDGGSDDDPVGLGLNAAGDVYVAGTTTGDYLVLKYAAASLNPLWQKRDGGAPREVASAMVVDPVADRVYLTGWSQMISGSRNFRTVAYQGSDGAVLWAAVTSYREGNHVPVDMALNGNVLAVTGQSGFQDTYDFLTISYDVSDPSNVTLTWSQTYDAGGGNEVPRAVAVDAQGRVYVAGQSGLAVAQNRDFLLVTYDGAGSLLADRLHTYDAGGDEVVRDITLGVDSDGLVSIHLAGGSDRPLPANGRTEADYTLVKYAAMRADLVADAVTAPAMMASESTVLITPTVRNVKDSAVRKLADAGAFSVEVSLATSTDPNTATLFPLGSYNLTALASGQSDVTALNVAIPPASVIPEGSYWVAVRVDSGNAIEETDETNNLFIGPAVTVVDPPDLVPTAIAVVNPNTASAPAASDITVEYAIDNIRSVATSGSFQVNFVFSTDTIIGNGDDVLLGSDTVNTVIAGNGSLPPTQAVVTIPNTLAPGAYYLGIVVDANDDILEARDDNNTLADTATFTVEAIPDFVMTAVRGPLGGVAGSPLTIDYTIVANDVGASNIKVQFYLSADQMISDTDIFLGVVGGHNLAAGVPLSATATLTVPAGTAQGVYYVGAIINQNNANQNDAIAESDDTNNSLAASGSTSIGLDAADPAALPDLVVTGVTGPASAARGNTISVTTSVTNILPKAITSPFTVGIYLSPDATITAQDLLLGTRSIAALTGNTTDTATTDVSIPFEQGEDVVWTDVVGVQVNGNSLRKVTGTGWNAGAVSTQRLEGDGYVEFTAVETDRFRVIGFSTSNVDNRYDSIRYSISLQSTSFACAYELGTILSCVAYASGDVFRIMRNGGTIYYQRLDPNTNTFETFQTRSAGISGPMLVDAALYNYNATLSAVRLVRNIVPGDYYLGAIADTEGVITEVDENNNVAVQTDAGGNPASTPIAVATGPGGAGGGGGVLGLVGVAGMLCLLLWRRFSGGNIPSRSGGTPTHHQPPP